MLTTNPKPETQKKGDLKARNFVENLEGNDPPLSAYAEVAANFGLPVWAMMVPGTTRDMFEDSGAKMLRLVRLMRDYLDASESQRGSIEAVAAELSEINRGRPAEVAHKKKITVATARRSVEQLPFSDSGRFRVSKPKSTMGAADAGRAAALSYSKHLRSGETQHWQTFLTPMVEAIYFGSDHHKAPASERCWHSVSLARLTNGCAAPLSNSGAVSMISTETNSVRRSAAAWR